MTKKEKIKHINEMFSNKYQGMQVELPSSNVHNIQDAKINNITKLRYRHKDYIETGKSYKTKLNIGVEKNLIDLIESSTYTRSMAEVKPQQNEIHKTTEKWHYFNKSLIVGSEIYSMIIDVRENINSEAFIYKIRLKEIDFEKIHKKYGEFSQIPRQGILNREQPPCNIYNNTGDDSKSQDLKSQKNDKSEEFFLSKDEEEMEF